MHIVYSQISLFTAISGTHPSSMCTWRHTRTFVQVPFCHKDLKNLPSQQHPLWICLLNSK